MDLTAETLSAVSLVEPAPDRQVERAGGALLNRALREGVRATVSGIQNAFFRLSAEERVILAALYRGHWSYARIARVLEITPEQVAERAWAARLHLVYRPGMTTPLLHATGTGAARHDCPEFHAGRPWTQKFLDSEIQGRELHFLQAHIAGCDSCRASLNRARQIHWEVEPQIPSAELSDSELGRLEFSLRASKAIIDPMSLSFTDGLRLYFSRPEGRRLLLGAVLLMSLLLYSMRSGGAI